MHPASKKKGKEEWSENFLTIDFFEASLAIIGNNDWGDLNKYADLMCPVFVVASL